MLTLRDCMDFAGLNTDQINAVARREQLTGLGATCLASKMLESDAGREELQALLREEAEAAIAKGDRKLARQLVAGFDAAVKSRLFH